MGASAEVAERVTGPDPAPGVQAEWARLAAEGMLSAYWARHYGDRIALYSPRGDRSFATLHANANRLLDAMRGVGLAPGAAVAAVCGNIPEFIEVHLACLRGGLRFTPVNWHLAPDEVAYILADCEATAWIVQAEFADKVATADAGRARLRLAVGGAIAEFDDYAGALAAASPADPAAPLHGRVMLYTSGTTGRPKGVIKGAIVPIMPMRGTPAFDYRDGDVNLLCGPAYHGGPLAFDILFPLASGASIVLLERFDPVAVLRAIETYRVTHTHMVSTMFQRLLALPDAERRAHDLSSLRLLAHGAAPTPPEVKHAMIAWLGPILWEYYAATEVATRINITSEEWLAHPGSVGRIPDDSGIRILADDGAPCPPGVAGRICFPNPAAAPTRYHNAPEKNRDVFGGADFTVGDVGHVDADGYLFLTGRSAETIISGGVNIYPIEVDNVLLQHPAVRQSCTVGVPDREWGEAVRAVVSLAPGHVAGPDLEADLIAFARDRLAHFKVPRGVDVIAEVPVSEAGKIQRASVCAGYWHDHGRAI